MLKIVLFGVDISGEVAEPTLDLAGVGTYGVSEGGEPVGFDLAAVEREGFDLVDPSAVGGVDGEFGGSEVVLEEVPVVASGLDVEGHGLRAAAAVDLCFEVDLDPHGLVARGDEVDLAVEVEAHGGHVLPLEVVEEERGAHGSGEVVEGGVVAVDGIGCGTSIGSEVVHQGVAHFGAGGHAGGREAEVLLKVGGE